ncbi:hypothetical protein Tco_0557161 [Tanacetum coccineum]
MEDLKFVDQHNMVTFLEKTEENVEFHQIIDFLSTCSINYALTVSPTIYASYIEQFWNTATSKTVNSVKQIHAIVDGKAVVISESSVRNDLLFDDEDGITCLTNDEIFENLALMGYEQLSTKLTFQKGSFSPQWKFLIHTILHCISSKSTGWNEFSTNLASAVICLAKGQKFNFSKLIFDGMLRNLDPKKFLMYPRFLQLFLNNQLKDLPEPFNDTYETPSHTKKVFSNMARQSKSFSGKVTQLFESILVQNQAPEEPKTELLQTKTPPTNSYEPQTEANIEQILPSPSIYQRKHKKTQKHRRAKKVTKLPQTSVPLDLGADEAVHKEGGMDTGGSPRRQETMGGASAQTRMAHTFELIDIVPPTPHDSPLLGDNTPRSDEVLDLEKEKDAQAVEILKLKKRVKKLERQRKSSISHPRRRIYRQIESFDDDLDEKDASKQGRKSDKTKPITVRPIVSTVGPSTSATVTSTGILEDEMVTMADILIAIRQTRTRPFYLPRPTSVVITDTEQEQRRLTTPPPLQLSDTRDKGKGIMVDPDPSVKIKRSDQGSNRKREREQFTIDERAQFLVETIAAQRKFRAAQRAAEIRSKPPTKTQLKNMMITYLKNTGKFNHNQLKGKSYEELQRLYEREQKWINDFVPIDSEKEEKKSVEIESVGKKGKRIKRVADLALKHKSSKKQKMMQEQESAKSDEDAAADYEHEKEELRMWLTVVLDEEETMDLEILSAKYPIVDWESHNLGNVDMEDLHVYKIIRADRNTSYHKSLFSMLRKFDRQDLVDLHRLVMKRFKDNTPEGYNLLLWGDLKVMFEPNAEDEIWSNQQDWTLISWKLYENYGVYTLLMDGTLTCFNMLVEKRYPLIKEMMEKMLNWKLEAETESTMAFELPKFIKSQLED